MNRVHHFQALVLPARSKRPAGQGLGAVSCPFPHAIVHALGLIPVPAAIMITFRWAGGGTSFCITNGPCNRTAGLSGSWNNNAKSKRESRRSTMKKQTRGKNKAATYRRGQRKHHGCYLFSGSRQPKYAYSALPHPASFCGLLSHDGFPEIDYEFVELLHPPPHTRETSFEWLTLASLSSILLIAPSGYRRIRSSTQSIPSAVSLAGRTRRPAFEPPPASNSPAEVDIRPCTLTAYALYARWITPCFSDVVEGGFVGRTVDLAPSDIDRCTLTATHKNKYEQSWTYTSWYFFVLFF